MAAASGQGRPHLAASSAEDAPLARGLPAAEDVAPVPAGDRGPDRPALLAEVAALRAADAFKTRFLNVAAHELGTPITPLKIHLHMLREGHRDPLTPRQRRSVDLLERNVDRLAALVQDLLESGKLQAGRLVLERRAVDVDELARDAAEVFLEPARLAGVTLDFQPGAGAVVAADPARVTQVLFNLLSNAVKFTPRGGRVVLATERRAGAVRVTVRDTGRGLRPEEREQLFQPFSQVPDPTAARGGTGLGLYISKGLVELHHGRIGAESAGLGQGATFWFELPHDAGAKR